MIRTVAEITAITDADRDQVKTWAWNFRNRLGAEANPPKGQVRKFTDDDALVMIFIAFNWSSGVTVEELGEMIDRDDHREQRYREHLYCHTPLLQEPPDGLDETWRHGCLYTPGFFTPFELARHYHWCADQLLAMAIDQDDALDLRSPILFAYRHALELYLKILGQLEERTHSLSDCLHGLEKRMSRKLRDPYRSWILELDAIDPGGTSFRYSESDQMVGLGSEKWIDYHHVKFAMDKLFRILDMGILNDQRVWENNPRANPHPA